MQSLKKHPLHGKGRKDDMGKLQWGLLLRSIVREVEDVVWILTFGAKKYAAENWKKVEDGEKRYLDAHDRHMSELAKGIKNDPETGKSHYAHALCSLFFAFWHSRNKK